MGSPLARRRRRPGLGLGLALLLAAAWGSENQPPSNPAPPEVVEDESPPPPPPPPPIEIDWTALADNIIRSSLLASNEESYLFRHGLTIESDIQALIYFFNNTAASAEVRSPWARSSRGAPG